MERLTTDAPANNLQTALNLFYAKDGEVWVRGGGPAPKYLDVTLNAYIRAAVKNLATEPELFDDLLDEKLAEVMTDWAMDANLSREGLLGVLYTAGWVCAELRARLKAYEDTGLMPEQVVGMQWIPAHVELPGREEVERYYQQYGEHPQYLVMIANAVYATILSFDGEEWYDSYTTEPYKVTHWMPLPAAPGV